MLKFVLAAMSSIISMTLVQADINLNFDLLEDPIEIARNVTTKGKVEILQQGQNNVLRVYNSKPPSNIRIPTRLKKRDSYTLTFDWRRSQVNSEIIRVYDKDHTNYSLRIDCVQNKVIAFTHKRGKDFTKKTAFSTKADNWYRFQIEVDDGEYFLMVANRGPKNNKNDVIYNSENKDYTLKSNPKIIPKMLFIAQWPGNGKSYFDYDNIVAEQ